MATKKSKTNKTKKVAKVEAKPAKTEKTTVVQNKPTKKKRTTIKEEIKDYLAERNNKVFIGNWKMNMKFDDIKSYFDHFNKLLKKDKILSQMNNLIGIAPTAIGLLPVAGMVKNGVMPVAQFVHHARFCHQ